MKDNKIIHNSQHNMPNVPIHGLLSFPVDVYGFFNTSRKLIWLPVNHCCLRPTDHIIFLLCQELAKLVPASSDESSW